MAPRPIAQPARKPRAFLAGLSLLLLAACQTAAPPPPARPPAHQPAFMRTPFEPFTRADAVAIALREWNAWGQRVDDDPPDSREPADPEAKPERMPGFWQRVGEYWWLGQNADSPTADWTGRYDAGGTMYSADRDEAFAWSAAFISYIMRSAGAGTRFPYSPAHATYINAARMVSLGQSSTEWAVSAMPPQTTAPVVGDLICFGRHGARSLRFADLPTQQFTSHCDIVVGITPGSLTVIGGNVDDAVTMKHVPVTADGMLAGPDGTPVDTRYPWFVVLRVLYQR